MKEETVKFVVARLLPGTWMREATKQAVDRVHDAKFDRQYEAMMKEKNLPVPAGLIKPVTKDKLIPQKLFDYVKVKIMLPKEEREVVPSAAQLERAHRLKLESEHEANDHKEQRASMQDPAQNKQSRRR